MARTGMIWINDFSFGAGGYCLEWTTETHAAISKAGANLVSYGTHPQPGWVYTAGDLPGALAFIADVGERRMVAARAQRAAVSASMGATPRKVA